MLPPIRGRNIELVAACTNGREDANGTPRATTLCPKEGFELRRWFHPGIWNICNSLLKTNKDTYRLCVCSVQRSKSVAACITDATHNIPKLIHVSNTRELLVEFHRSKGDQPRRPRATGRGKVGCKVLFEASTLSKIRFSHIDARETERVM